MSNWKLIRTDKNGTKYYQTDTCQRCGGLGHLHGYEHVEGGICFECNGSGISRTITRKEYTPEYAEKLEQRRIERGRKKAPEKNERMFGKFGLASDGSAWVVMGETYSHKEELKAAGAHFHPHIGWYFADQVEDFNVRRFPVEDFAWQDCCGVWEIGQAQYWNEFGEKLNPLAAAIAKAQEEYASGKSASNYFGEVGEKVTVPVRVVRVAGFETQYGWTSVYTFEDADGNIFVWKTSSCHVEENSKCVLCGKIKEHKEYKGIKQTVLTRCKVKDAE